MPLATNALTTLTDIKSYLKLSIEHTEDDDLVESLINACSTAIENYCGRKFKEQLFTEEHDGNGKRYILLEQFPVASINSVEIDGVAIATSDFKVKKNNGVLIKNNGVWPPGDINIAVSYTAGLKEIPFDLELACKHLIMSYFKSDIASYSTTFQDGFVFRPEAFPSQVKILLAPYKKVM